MQAMSFAKSVLEGFTWIKCKCSDGGKNSLVHYIAMQDLLKDTLKKNKKITNFKLTLPNTRNLMAVWATGTPW